MHFVVVCVNVNALDDQNRCQKQNSSNRNENADKQRIIKVKLRAPQLALTLGGPPIFVYIASLFTDISPSSRPPKTALFRINNNI